MAAPSRRCLAVLTRHCRSLLLPSQLLEGASTSYRPSALSTFSESSAHLGPRLFRHIDPLVSGSLHHFSSRTTVSSGEEEDEDDDDEGFGEDEEEGSGGEESDGDEDDGVVSGPRRSVVSGKSDEEKVSEAAAIGYQVIGPLESSERPFKPWEPVFAVVQIGSHQFKVCNGDSIFTERLKFCEVNDKLILNKVLMLGSKAQTIIGRPILPEAAVHAVVEEHALDAKVIIFKKKRRKNYRRTKGHRQELTKLRITDIQGIDKPTRSAIPA
ncbi:unnamed protein product [Spirodela intermedia]|uniref:Large ribosomal subunit protein bL21m n=1 Tax=Spirodela intermedia TaxID=51605 RepID=A0A7I8KK77_SPIIN|nr:unnamed protein product [Spirodela intermedia]